MTTFMLQLGDVYADGHGMYEEIHVQVPSMFTLEELQKNFELAKLALKFDPARVAESYDDSVVEVEVLQPLVDAGFDFSDEVDSRFNDEELYVWLGPDSFAEILMFLFGYDLEGFEWNFVEKPPVLNRETYGYGLFSL